MNEQHWMDKKCPPINCRKKQCECGLEKVFLSAALGDDSKDSPIAPKNGEYCNAIVVYEANGHMYIYSKEGIPTLITSGGGGDYDEIIKEIQEDLTKTEGDLAQEVLDRAAGDKTLQDEIDDLKNSPDVVDIVDTYADLQAYDTSHLGDKDIIRVLTDETHDGVSSYYRWDKQTETWTYIGSIQTAANTIFYADLSETGNTRHIYKNSDMTGTVSVQELLDANEDGQVILRMSSAQTPENFNDAYLQNTYVGVGDYQFLFLDNRNYYEYDGTATTDTSYYYSKSTIQLELTAGNNITITGNTISATDTTYSNFTGTDGVSAGTAGLVPAPATTDAGKFLKADGTWDTAGGGGPTVVQTTGTSTTDVMSQDATTKMVYPQGESYKDRIGIGLYAGPWSSGAVAIGSSAYIDKDGGIAIGMNARATHKYSVGLGNDAQTTRQGEVFVGCENNNYGYNNTKLRVIGGVHDGQSDHDAVTLGQLNGRVKQNAGAPTTSTVGTVGQLLEDTTNGKLYQCTAIDNTDPNNPSYTWTEVGAGGGSGPTVVQTTGTSTTDVMSQDATTTMVFDDPSTRYNVQIGSKAAGSSPNHSVAIGNSTKTSSESITIGENTATNGQNQIAIGRGAMVVESGARGCIALGDQTRLGGTAHGVLSIGPASTSYGYNSTNFRLITGVYDGQGLHDAATVAQGNTLATVAPDTSTVGVLGQLWTDTTNMHTYQCTAISGSTYTWTQRW